MESSPGCERCERILDAVERFQQRLADQAAHTREVERHNRDLERELGEKQAHLERLEKRLAELEQRPHASAAPFRRRPEQRKATPQPPGRKPGHPGAYRKPPPTVTETVEAPLCGCPHCQGPVHQVRRREQIVEDLPPIAPLYRRVITYTGQCPRCGPVESRHPFQVSTAVGAAGVQLGPGVLALAAELRYGLGLTLPKTCRLLGEQFHLSLTPGGLAQALARLAERLTPEYQALQQAVRASPSVHADETGWWLGGQHAWLWVVATLRATCYRISAKRQAAVLAAVLGEEYAGTLVSDCLNVYDRYPARRKSKCVGHHLRAIVAAQQQAPNSRFLARAKRLFQAALTLARWREPLPAARYARGVASLERRLDALLASTPALPAEGQLARRLQKQRAHLLTFLHEEGVAATNNLAERQLRPAVITRKLSCGNKTWRGARTFEVLASLAATCRQQGERLTEVVVRRLRVGAGTPSAAPP